MTNLTVVDDRTGQVMGTASEGVYTIHSIGQNLIKGRSYRNDYSLIVF